MNKNNQAPLVIKIGGTLLLSNKINQFFMAIADYQQSAQRQLIIVHGGGNQINELMTRLQLDTPKREGLRITPNEHIPFIVGALAGTVNKQLQGQAVANGLKTIGLCLADGNLCHVDQLDSQLGAVGKASPNDPRLLQAILHQGALPIINSIGLTKNGQMMNVNADQAAVAVAAAIDADLVLLSDVAGVLDAKGELIKVLSEEKANILIDNKVITDGMIVKVKAALNAANKLGRPVEVTSWHYPEKLITLFAGESIGTQFLPQ